jgi:hypothetical protein
VTICGLCVFVQISNIQNSDIAHITKIEFPGEQEIQKNDKKNAYPFR